MSKGTDGNGCLVELPENVTSQDIKADGNKSNTVPKSHRNANVNPNDRMTSKNKETEVPENRQCQKGGSKEPTNTPSQDESPWLDPNTETATIDDIPNTEFHPAWISGTVYNADTHRNYFMDEAIHHVDPRIQGTAGETVESFYHPGSDINEFVMETFLNSVSEIGGIVGDTVQSTDSENGGILGDAPQRLTHQPFSLYSAESSKINSLKANDNYTISDILSDSVDHLENDVTQMSKSLTVNTKTDTESASCIFEDQVPDTTGDRTTENNSDVRLLISSFPQTPIIIPSKTEEDIDTDHSAMTQRTYRSDTSNESWVDASDEWGFLPASRLTPTSSDNTRTSKTGAGSLELPTNESWSSSDSWASALSDLIHREDVDMNRTQDLAVNMDGETQSGLEEEEDERWNDTEGRLENECVYGSEQSNELWEVTEDAAFEEEGERNHGGLSFSRYPFTPESEVQLLNSYEAEHLTLRRGVNRSDVTHLKDNGSCTFPSKGEVDFIMPLTSITIGTSYLHLKEDPDVSRTSLREEVRPDLTLSTGGKSTVEPSDSQFCDITKQTGDQDSSSSSREDQRYKTEAGDVSSELQSLILHTGERLMICEEKHVAYVSFDVDDILSFKKHPEDRGGIKQVRGEACERDNKMPHKTQKKSSENKTRSNKHKDKTNNNQTSKKRENVRPEAHDEESVGAEESAVTTFETIVITEAVTSRPQGKKKKKHEAAKVENEPLVEVENGTKPKNTKSKNETATTQPSKVREKLANYEGKEEKDKATEGKTKASTETSSVVLPGAPDDDIIKRRRISGDKPAAVSIRTRPQLPAIFQQKEKEDVVTQTIQTPKEVPRVLSDIEAAPVVDDPQSISLWCRFSHIMADSSIMWVKEGATLREEKKKVGDDARVSLSLLKPCSKDLGFYRCSLVTALGSVSTSDFHLTSEVLMELVIPNHEASDERKAIDGEEEDVSCASLLFKDDILTDQYFGEQQHTSIVTEKDHFGEGMHRRAFRTMVRTGMTPLFGPGHSCVLKVHSAIGYGTQNSNEVVQRNYSLAVEECYVQNTAREYIKAYTDVAKSAETFGEVPEIIPIVLVHRPSNAVPYATLEEELIGDFVKYSVKDGKEINLTRRDSEAGQKCCAFQHWVYMHTEGNLLVTDMQGVGMKLTDVGIATCKKGYKGFKGNCSTSFIDQFKALHQCNRFCELLGLTSLQPKAKRTAPPNPKTQPAARKKPFGPTVKGKS
ncbi:alpha-protein kinase 2 isoform X1 [Tachysurus vachellii]|uniref:alpha-protein kinase 2 isoform X1 n=1 Tax=Tachysurus vachellii TaxID=175792 RepID=UPI00296AFD7F|nr:alpha-protein kinase 2 isoform X1 [Tachysurus vachellii]